MTTQLAHINGRFFHLDMSFLLYAMKWMAEIVVLTSNEIIVSRSKKPTNEEKIFMNFEKSSVKFGRRWDIPYQEGLLLLLKQTSTCPSVGMLFKRQLLFDYFSYYDTF